MTLGAPKGFWPGDGSPNRRKRGWRSCQDELSISDTFTLCAPVNFDILI